jgi:amidase
MARSVRDAAILLGAMTGTDAEDPITQNTQEAIPDYTANLAADGLAGKRIGIIRSYYGAGSNPDVEAIFESTIETLREQGAEIIDSIEIDTTGMGDAESTVLRYEFKADLKQYLEQTGAPFGSLAEIIKFNEDNKETVMPFFGQERMLASQGKGPLTDDEYLVALETSKSVSQRGIDSAMTEHDLDALIAPTNGPAWLTDHVNGDSFHVGSSSFAAVSGYPNVTVPAGFISGLPVGVSFIGQAFSEKSLIEIAYAFEQATSVRRPPEL